MSDVRLIELADLDDDAVAALYEPGGEHWLRVNFVTSLDGAVTLDGYSAGLSGPADKRVFGILRMRCDALLVGAGTLRTRATARCGWTSGAEPGGGRTGWPSTRPW